jgi:hypothetical protein
MTGTGLDATLGEDLGQLDLDLVELGRAPFLHGTTPLVSTPYYTSPPFALRSSFFVLRSSFFVC